MAILSLHTLFYEDYINGRQYLLSNGKKILIRGACFTDVPRIVSLLQSIQITPDNISEKLSNTLKNNFKRRGGFFKVWNAKELVSIMEDVKNLILVAVSKEKEREVIYGFLWCRLSLDSIQVSDWKLENNTLDNNKTENFNKAIRKNLVFTAVECAILPNYHGIGISFSIIQEMYAWLWDRGYLYAVLQVYNIKGEYQNENIIQRNLPNKASINHIKKYGAVWIKKTSLPDQIVGQRKFKVNADIFLLDLEYAVKKLEELTSKYCVAK